MPLASPLNEFLSRLSSYWEVATFLKRTELAKSIPGCTTVDYDSIIEHLGMLEMSQEYFKLTTAIRKLSKVAGIGNWMYCPVTKQAFCAASLDLSTPSKADRILQPTGLTVLSNKLHYEAGILLDYYQMHRSKLHWKDKIFYRLHLYYFKRWSVEYCKRPNDFLRCKITNHWNQLQEYINNDNLFLTIGMSPKSGHRQAITTVATEECICSSK